MSISILQVGVVYKDGQDLGNITVGTETLKARARVYADKGNLLTIQTYRPIRDAFPDRSNYADHSKDFGLSHGLTQEEVQYFAPFTALQNIGWTDDERHLNTPSAPNNWMVGENPDASMTFKIATDGTISTAKVAVDDTTNVVNKFRQASQQATQSETDAKKAKEEHDSLLKKVKTGAWIVGGLLGATVLFFVGRAIFRKINEKGEDGGEDKKGKKKD